MSTTSTATKRKAYAIYAPPRYSNTSKPPAVVVYDCVITPKRIAVFEAGTTRNASYYDPAHFPKGNCAWTIAEAWQGFLAGEQRTRENALATVQYAERNIAAAEEALRHITEDK
jgi:hypothetical protein